MAFRLDTRPLLFAVLALATSCVDPNQFLPPGQAGGPMGVLEGTVTYSGPPPCTEKNAIVGAAVLLVFDTKALPPPEGLGTTAQSLAVVGGETLFGGIRSSLTFDPGGARVCPDASAPPVTVSASWAASPLTGGTYEVRGFYDYDGNFDPVFSITKLPTKGDIAGGAIDNAADVLQGKAPVYRQITLGMDQGDAGLVIPAEGVDVSGIAVTLGLPLPDDLPVFNVAQIANRGYACNGMSADPVTPPQGDIANPTMPADYRLPIFKPLDTDLTPTEQSFIRLTLSAGVPASEVEAASAPPFGLPVAGSPSFTFTWQDVNSDNMIDIEHDHVAASDLLASLFPLAIFSKLDDAQTVPSLAKLTPQSLPIVIMQGLTLYQGLEATKDISVGTSTTMLPAQDPNVIVALQPAVICIDPRDVNKPAKLVVAHKTDCAGNPLLANENATRNALRAQFGHPVDPVIEACLPKGRFAMNLVYSTGQAWTLPNEAGVCAAGESNAPNDTTKCVANVGSRPRLASQDVVLTIGDPDDPSFCKDHPTPPECCPGGMCP